MKCRQCQLDIAKMSIALIQVLAAGFARSVLGRYTHVRVEWTIALYCPVSCQVEKVAVTNLEYRLVYDVLLGPARQSIASTALKHGLESPQYSKFKRFYALWHIVQHLLLYCRRHGGRFHTGYRRLCEGRYSILL